MPRTRQESSAKQRPDSSRWLDPRQVQFYANEGTTAYRVGGTAAGWVERYGDDFIVSWRIPSAQAELVAGLRAWAASLDIGVRRVFGREVPRQPSERDAPVLLEGDPAASRHTVVTEGGVRFGIDFTGGYSAGLFVDQRHNRALVRRLRPPRLLNCFAYTCSFSVAAALEGGRTTNIDLSARALERGRKNFQENRIGLADHRFMAKDVLEALRPLLERREPFDMVILDPPTFSRGASGQAFHVERDLEPLLLAAMELVAGPGRILLSTNSARLGDRDLEGMARRCLRHQRRAGDLHREPTPVPMPAGPAASTLWVVLR